MELLIDFDSALYKAGCSNETRWYEIRTPDGFVVQQCQYKKEATAVVGDDTDLEIVACKEAGPLGHTLANLKNIIEGILDVYPVKYQLFIAGKGNFRDDIYPDYKGHRDASGKPLHLKDMKEYLLKRYNTFLVDGEEADDRVSWLQCTAEHETMIVGVDKDLDNTPGHHYNFQHKHEYLLTEEEADFNFATQLLTGDSTDNIPGLPGVGKGTAAKILPEYIPTWQHVVWDEYQERGFDMDYMVLQGRLLWMRRKPEEWWYPRL